MTRNIDFTSLDLSMLEAVHGGAQGPLLGGPAAEQVYDALRARAKAGYDGVTSLDNVSDGALHGSVDAGSLSCDSVERPNRRRVVTCDLAPR